MKKINNLALGILFVLVTACSSPSGTQPSPNPSTSASSQNTSPTATPSSITQSSNPSPSATATPQVEIQSINTGTSFGFCMGYCTREATFNSEKVVVSKSSTRSVSDSSYPTVTKEQSFSQNDWNNLVSLVDLNKFNSLEERIGCPDCADGGSEWIDITSKNGKKRVTFEYNKDVPEIQTLVTKIRELRNKYLEVIKD